MLNLRQRSWRFALLALFLAGITIPGMVAAQTRAPQITHEYFVQQAADEALLIKINAFEAEFESKLSGQDGELLLLSGIPGSRIVPVFQYVSAPKSARQLDIETTSSLQTGRSKFELELTRLMVWDDRSHSVSRAYQLLSFGMQSSSGGSKANWTVKIDSLINAGRLFQQFGMEEMRLWANYLAAHLIQLHLHDHSIVYSMTREILADLKGTRLHKIQLATLQLQSAALIGLRKSGSLRTSASDPGPIQSVLSQAAELASSMGFQFEQASALNASGIEYASGSFYAKALEQFQRAMGIVDSVADAQLASSIRDSIVQIHAIQGNAPASGEVLREAATQLLEEGAGDELALNLLAQGRLFIRGYRYRQAIGVLTQALNHENNSAVRKQINFELARVFYASGRLDESMAYLQRAEVAPGAPQTGRSNPVVDVGEGLWIMANIHRARGEYEPMRTTRSAQAQYKPASARYFYDRGLDELAASGTNRQRAQSLFRQSHTAASTTGLLDLQHLSRLQYCALGHAGDDVKALCSKASVKTSYKSLVTGGVPGFATEAMFLWTQILVINGRPSEAVTVMDRLLDEIHFLRHSLPGVLGAWYRERHEQLFEYHLELLATSPAPHDRADGSASLLVLSKTRYINKYTDFEPVSNAASGDADLLRDQLAQRANSAPGPALSALNDKINQGLARIRVPFEKKFEYLSKTGLQNYLRGLAPDELVLTYHISPTTAQVWVGQKGRVKRRNIANPDYLYAALHETRQGLADIGIAAFDSKMDALGEHLIAPVADLLTTTIYWIPAGPLLGFPLDAVRLNRQYLLERHSVVNLLSFPANMNPGASLQTGSLQSVFLAGHPQDYSGGYATRLETSPEIQAIADIFVGPGLRIVQGAALLPDEFQNAYFQQANLVHLAMPGVIDLRDPEQSSLELSGSENVPGRASLTSKDIQSQKLEAGLVFLSATRIKDDPISGLTNQTGLVSDFVDAGAQSVIANLWAGNGEAAQAFISNFYRKLEVSGNTASALKDAKRQYLKGNRDNGLYDWAGYQLFIN